MDIYKNLNIHQNKLLNKNINLHFDITFLYEEKNIINKIRWYKHKFENSLF